MKYYVEWGGQTRVVEILGSKEGTRVLVDGEPFAADLAVVGDTGLYSLLLGGQSVAFAARFEPGVAVLELYDRQVRVPIEDERTRESKRLTAGSRKGAGKGDVRSIMPGVVKEVRVAPGDAVTLYQPLLVLEAMKMETNVTAPVAGKVKKINVNAGDGVQLGQILVEFE